MITKESVIEKTFTLSLRFDKLTRIVLKPFALSLSKDNLSTNGYGLIM
ncbi:MAG: hypothetical protein ACE144_14265 [Thermodesulfobacteriota bacterium]